MVAPGWHGGMKAGDGPGFESEPKQLSRAWLSSAPLFPLARVERRTSLVHTLLATDQSALQGARYLGSGPA
jgi:hypothetical protein